jgi:hypothetical protein
MGRHTVAPQACNRQQKKCRENFLLTAWELTELHSSVHYTPLVAGRFSATRSFATSRIGHVDSAAQSASAAALLRER